MVFTHSALAVAVQTPKTELYDLIKKLLIDSIVYEEVGDWALGQPKKISSKMERHDKRATHGLHLIKYHQFSL